MHMKTCTKQTKKSRYVDAIWRKIIIRKTNCIKAEQKVNTSFWREILQFRVLKFIGVLVTKDSKEFIALPENKTHGDMDILL